MKFVLAFENSGDTIPFTGVNNDIVEYFVDQLNARNANRFAVTDGFSDRIASNIQHLADSIADINCWIFEILDHDIGTYLPEEYLDQTVLNRLHRDWAKSQNKVYPIAYKRKKYKNSKQSELIHSLFNDDTPMPTVGTVLSQMNLLARYNQINEGIHELEQNVSSELICFSTNWVEFKNPYPETVLTNDVCNFKIAFHHLGRALYEKYINFDLELDFDDENNFDELVGAVSICLRPEQTVPFSQEYVSWCQHHQRTPTGMGINAGSIDNLSTHLTQYRQILFRNSRQNNKFSIQLNKG